MTWDSYQQSRLGYEQALLRTEFPDFTFRNLTADTYVTGMWAGNFGTSYSLRIELPAGFPDECPSTYITWPSPLFDYWGNPMESLGTSSHMHVWQTDRPGWLKICTYRPAYWSADQALTQVILKATYWILSYESHLQRGEDIDVFMPHIRG